MYRDPNDRRRQREGAILDCIVLMLAFGIFAAAALLIIAFFH